MAPQTIKMNNYLESLPTIVAPKASCSFQVLLDSNLSQLLADRKLKLTFDKQDYYFIGNQGYIIHETLILPVWSNKRFMHKEALKFIAELPDILLLRGVNNGT